jgi:hypothetical protein
MTDLAAIFRQRTLERDVDSGDLVVATILEPKEEKVE